MNRLAALLAVEALVMLALLSIVADLIAHKRVERLGGVNAWGYRGPVLSQKGAHETRLAVIGGDLAFGWGVAPTETTAAYLRQAVGLVREMSGSPRTVTTVDLGARGLSTSAYAAWIERYAGLYPDALCLIPDPPEHAPSDGRFLPNRASRAFRAYGYSPILPLVLEEKATVSGSTMLHVAARVADAVDRMMAVQLPPSSAQYDTAVASAVEAGLRVAPAGVVVGATARASVFRSRFAREPRVRVVDLEQADDVHDASLQLDGFSWSAGGHARVAQQLAPAMLELVR